MMWNLSANVTLHVHVNDVGFIAIGVLEMNESSLSHLTLARDNPSIYLSRVQLTVCNDVVLF
jgi:hypothetical protein